MAPTLKLTNEAAEGYDWQRQHADLTSTEKTAAAADLCPYAPTSASASAWHLGRHLARGGFERPGKWGVFTTPQAGVLRLGQVAFQAPDDVRFRMNPDNTFRELV